MTFSTGSSGSGTVAILRTEYYRHCRERMRLMIRRGRLTSMQVSASEVAMSSVSTGPSVKSSIKIQVCASMPRIMSISILISKLTGISTCRGRRTQDRCTTSMQVLRDLLTQSTFLQFGNELEQIFDDRNRLSCENQNLRCIEMSNR